VAASEFDHDHQGSISDRGMDFFFTATFKIFWVHTVSCPVVTGVRWKEHQTDHSSPFSTEVKNALTLPSPLSADMIFMITCKWYQSKGIVKSQRK
jgi:hypothetical protein